MSKSESRLRKWALANAPSEEMLYKDAYWQQINFVADRIAGLMARSYEQCCDLVGVAGTHRSKSITLPQDELRLWMRDNFHDWNVSVSSGRPIDCDFLGCFDDRNHGYCFCQGMPEGTAFGPYAENHREFTVCINSQYDVYVFFRALKKFFGIVAP